MQKIIQGGKGLLLVISLIFGQISAVYRIEAQNFDVLNKNSDEIESGSSIFVFKRSTSIGHNKSVFGASVSRRTSKQRDEQRKRINSQVKTVTPENNTLRPKVRSEVSTNAPERNNKMMSLAQRVKASEDAFKIGEEAGKRGEMLKAIEAYKKSLAFYSKNEKTLTALAETYTKQSGKLYKEDDFENAAKVLEEAAKLDSDNPDIYAKLGNCYDELKKTGLAIQNYERALQLNSKLTEIYFPLAVLNFENDNLAAADVYVQVYLLQNDKNPEAYNLQGIIRNKQNRNPEAVEQFNRAINLKNDFADAYHNLGDSLDKLDRDKEAAAAFQKALEFYKAALPMPARIAEAYYDLGVANYNRKRFPEALAAYKQAFAIKPDYYEAERNLAETYRRLNKFPEAVEIYRNILTRAKNRDKKDLAEIYSEYGFCAGQVGSWKESIALLKKSIEMDPDSGDYANLGWAYNNAAEIGKDEKLFREAKSALEESLKIDANSAPAHYNLGIALAALKDFTNAVNSFRTSLKLRKDWAEAQKALGTTLIKAGNFDEGIKEIRRAIKLKEERGQDFSEARFELAVALLNTGKIKEAREQAEKLKTGSPARAVQFEEILKSYNPNAPKTPVSVPTPTPTAKKVPPKTRIKN